MKRFDIITEAEARVIDTGATVELSITKLFMIGLVPGLLIGFFLLIMWFFIARIDGYTDTITFTRPTPGVAAYRRLTPPRPPSPCG